MTWFEKVRKIVPTNKDSLGFVVVNGAQTAQALKDIKNATYKPTGLKEVLRTIQNKQLNPEQFLEMYEGSPHLDQTLEQILENIEKIKNSVGFLTVEEVKAMLKEALEAKSNDNYQKSQKILKEIEENADLGRATLERNRDIRDSLEVLRMTGDKSVMMFKNPPKDKKILEDFAKLIDGTVIGDSIEVPFKTEGEFIATMAFKRKTKGKDADNRILDSPEEQARKQKIKEFYNNKDKDGKPVYSENWSFRKSGWSLNIGAKHIELNNLVAQKKLFVAGDVRYKVIEPFTAGSVTRYIVAVDKVKGSVRAFLPKVFPNGEPVPESLFLDKSSSNSVNLNPYGRLIMEASFENKETWFKEFFDTLRSAEILSEEDAYNIVIDDIYDSLREDKNSSTEGINLTPFKGAGGITNIDTASKEVIITQIKKIINESGRLSAKIIDRTYNKQSEQLQYLKQGAFTVKEAIEYEKWWKSQGNDPDELKIQYFKDGKPTADKKGKYQGFKTDDEGNFIRSRTGQLIPLTDEEGKILYETDEGKEKANYAKVFIFDDFDEEFVQTNPSEAYSFGLKVKTTARTEGQEKRTTKTITDLEGLLQSARKKLASAPKDPKKRESFERRVKSLESQLEDAKSRKSGNEQGDLQADVGKIRDELLVVDNFAKYVLNLALKLKDEGGLMEYVNFVDRQSSALDRIDPKRSINFIAQADELAGNEEVREAFKTIDKNPESDEAQRVAEQLNDKMPTILKTIQSSLVKAFKQRLTDFCEKPQNFPNHQVMPAIEAFTEQRLIQQGE